MGCPKTPQLAPLNLQEQWLYSEALQDCQAPHPITEIKASNTVAKPPVPMTLFFQSLPSAHDHR